MGRKKRRRRRKGEREEEGREGGGATAATTELLTLSLQDKLTPSLESQSSYEAALPTLRARLTLACVS